MINSFNAKNTFFLPIVFKKVLTFCNFSGECNPDDSVGEGKIYSRPGDPLCPVKSFQKYISKLHPSCDALWQRPLETFNENDSVWYCKSPLGKNTLSHMMAKISKLAKLSRIYTNHCLRATAITHLDTGGFEARHIMRASGHRSEASIRSYSSRLTESKQREMSDCLSKPFKNESVNFIPGTTSSPLKELSEQELLTIFSDDNMFSELPLSPILKDQNQQGNVQQIPRQPQPKQQNNVTAGENTQLLPIPVHTPNNSYQQENIQHNFRQQIRQSTPVYNFSNCVVHFNTQQ